jgi:integrase
VSGPEPRLHLIYGKWPAADRLLWERAFHRDHDPFSDAAGARLAEATQARCMWAWRRLLGFLALHEPTSLAVAPIERLTIERVRAVVAHLAETCAPQSVASNVDALYTAARVMMPECDWAWLKAIKARLLAAAPAHTPLGPVITSLQLLDLGQQLMDESKQDAGTPISKRAAVQYRDGLMAALLAFHPIRHKNLAALEIGRHFVLERGRWFILIPREETKTGAAIEFEIPELLNPYLTFYLDVVRPRMLRHPTCTALWVSDQGGALSYVTIKHVFKRLSSRIGFRIAAHDARDAMATSWAIWAPDRIGVASEVLGHSDPRTLRHYNRARGIEASRAYSGIIAGIRRGRTPRSR